MVQFAIKDEEEIKTHAIFERMTAQTNFDLQAYFNNAYKSIELGRVIYDLGLFPIYKLLERNIFIKAFAQIVEGEKNLGSIESYLKILYAIFGDSAQITVTKNPLHLKIDIIAPIQAFYLWITKKGEYVITKSGKRILLKQGVASVSDRELLDILKATTTAGTYVEFTLNRPEE